MPVKYADMLIVEADELLTLNSDSAGPRIGQQMSQLGIIKNGALAVKDGQIVAVGETKELADYWYSNFIINARDKVVMPGFVDCHTHAVFAGTRENGEDIYHTIRETRKATSEELFKNALKRLKIMVANGTTAVEIKSGYGLDEESEFKILEVIRRLADVAEIDVVSTFLGAHVYSEFEQGIDHVLSFLWTYHQGIFAEYCDVFCDKGAISLEHMEQILEVAKANNYKIKLHAGQFNDIGAVELGVKYGATSIDHLDFVSNEAIETMAETKTIGVLLPGVSFHLMYDHCAPARKLIDAGVPIALATDFNPGSSPIISMQVIVGLACRQMKMTPAEALTASTLNAAYAIDQGDRIGSLEAGKQADIIILDVPNYRQIPYWFGQNLVETVIKKGKVAV